MKARWRLVCGLCGTRAVHSEVVECARCGGATVVEYDAESRDAVDSGVRGVWRYRRRLPLEAGARAVTLGEGDTALVLLEHWAKRIGLQRVYAKLEYAGPTGSFKDRGASVLVSHALAGGATRIVEDSSGNAGASIAAYAARAGLGCGIFAPAAAPTAKLRQISAYGAELTLVEGSRKAVEMAARGAARSSGVYYAGHNANPYFAEGTKTFAFEVAEAFGARGPDHVVMPVGGGSLYIGASLGFIQWQAAGLCEELPRMHLVQASACMPLVAAFLAGAEVPLPVVHSETVAGGIEIEAPARGTIILRTLRTTGGCAVAVEEEAILEAGRQLAETEGIFMEPTSAAAFAGLARLAALGYVAPRDSVVVPVTGTGLKDAPQPLRG